MKISELDADNKINLEEEEPFCPKSGLLAEAKLKVNRGLKRFYYNWRSWGMWLTRPEINPLELTNYCNLRCVKCPYPQMTREKGYMDFDLFKTIINQLASWNRGIWVSGIGESLLHPRIFDMLDY